MALTVEQAAAISAELSVDLSLQTDDRLIELCLLYRSAPSALPSFPDALGAEITRRFTAAEIAANDVMFSVINNFSNQFNPELRYKEKMYEVLNSLDREVWFGSNISFFESTINTPERIAWVVGNNEMMTVITSSSIAMSAVAASSIAMTAIAPSSIAMSAIAASSTALAKIVVSIPARNALMVNNAVFQSVKTEIYSTVKATWTRHVGIKQAGNELQTQVFSSINSAVSSPLGFVVATLGGSNATNTSARVVVKHPTGANAATGNSSTNPESIISVDVVTFNGATFQASIDFSAVFAELWIPLTI